jgi:hypothetical protein
VIAPELFARRARLRDRGHDDPGRVARARQLRRLHHRRGARRRRRGSTATTRRRTRARRSSS